MEVYDMQIIIKSKTGKTIVTLDLTPVTGSELDLAKQIVDNIQNGGKS
jgi:hypothetical protein